MSSRNTQPLQLSSKTDQDFVDILRYRGETWVEAQLVTYRDKINEAPQALRGSRGYPHPASRERRGHARKSWTPAEVMDTHIPRVSTSVRQLQGAARQS